MLVCSVDVLVKFLIIRQVNQCQEVSVQVKHLEVCKDGKLSTNEMLYCMHKVVLSG